MQSDELKIDSYHSSFCTLTSALLFSRRPAIGRERSGGEGASVGLARLRMKGRLEETAKGAPVLFRTPQAERATVTLCSHPTARHKGQSPDDYF
ncbi:MAG TPA: hypothetical protein VGC66_05920 [Pyrinomonadaceae bacterium]